MTNFICKLFKAIPRANIVDRLSKKLYLMAMSKDTLKKKYDNGDISEWAFYKRLWNLRGRLQMLEEIIDLFSKKGN